MIPLQDTIVAIATPPGRGGIGVVRFWDLWPSQSRNRLFEANVPSHLGQARFAELLDPTYLGAGKSPTVLDQAIVRFFKGPQSSTSDALVEISLHGSPVLLDTVLRYALANGARLAEPKEFASEPSFPAAWISPAQKLFAI